MNRARVLAAVWAAVLTAAGLVVSTSPAGAVPASGSSPAVSSPASPSGVGSSSLAVPVSGSRYIYVATNGTDLVSPDGDDPDWASPYSREGCLNTGSTPGWAADKPLQERCPEPSVHNPLRTIQTAIKVADPGDVIVVRAGTYTEQLGWAARAGTQTKPIVMQAAPGERVDVLGDLIIKNPDWWTIEGFRFGYKAGSTRSQSVVTIAGGTSWRFVSNEVYGSRGVANLLVIENGAVAARNYLIAGNCIRDNQGADAHGTDHNIYLMPGVASTGGVIEYNLIAGAPRGSNIKASGNDADGSPHNVQIRYNTLLNAASGVIVGLRAEGIVVNRNLISGSLGSNYYDGGLKTYGLVNPTANSFTHNLIAGYANTIRETGDVRVYVPTAGNIGLSSEMSYSGSIANCSVALTDPKLAALYGQGANPSASPPAPDIERLAGSDRYATAVKISQEFASGVERVYLATGLNYADALSAGPAAAHDGGPLLLTAPDHLPDAVRAEITRLDPDEVVLVGGTSAISEAVEQEVADLGPTPIRIAGADRYDTSAQIADFAFASAGVAYVANGGNFPDALAAGPAASDAGGPVVLVNGSQDSVDQSTITLLRRLGVTAIKIAGGTAVVKPGIQSALSTAGFSVTRLAGADRFATAGAINAHQFTSTSGVTTVFVATGYSFADALAGSALAGVEGGPLYIAEGNCLPGEAILAIITLGADNVTLFGGTGVLGNGVASLTSC